MGALWVLSTLVASAGMQLEIEFSLWLPDAKRLSVQPENWKGGGKVTFPPPRCACVSVCVSV